MRPSAFFSHPQPSTFGVWEPSPTVPPRCSVRMRSSFAMLLAMVLVLIDTSAAQCTNDCGYAGDTVCDDGGPGAQFAQVCNLGTDCSDCGPRVAGPPPPGRPPSPRAPPPPAPAVYPPAPVGMFYRCDNTCSADNDNTCNDGGPGSEFSCTYQGCTDRCTLGTDCADCGPRLIVMAPPSAPSITPDIVVGFDMRPSECTWSLTCASGYYIPYGVMPQTISNPPFVAGSTCTLTLYSQNCNGWWDGTWEYMDLSFSIYDDTSCSETHTFTVPYPSPPPGPPNLPPVAPIANNTGFAMVVPQLIITYKFNGLSTVCTASNSQLTGCTPGSNATAPTPSVAGTKIWDPQNNGRLVAGTITQMGCGGTPRCKVALGSPVDTTNGGIKTLIIKATVTWTDAARVRTCPPIAPSAPPSPPSRPPPPPPPLPIASSEEISVEMIALGMGLYHERYGIGGAPRTRPPPPPPHR
jgi:hypothetical protein